MSATIYIHPRAKVVEICSMARQRGLTLSEKNGRSTLVPVTERRDSRLLSLTERLLRITREPLTREPFTREPYPGGPDNAA